MYTKFQKSTKETFQQIDSFFPKRHTEVGQLEMNISAITIISSLVRKVNVLPFPMKKLCHSEQDSQEQLFPLLHSIQHFSLHSVLKFSTPQHEMDHLLDRSFWVFLDLKEKKKREY